MNDADKASIVMRALRGDSLSPMAAEYGVTKQGIQMIVKRAGAAEAAREVRKQIAEANKPKHDACATRCGVSKDEWRRLSDAGILGKWQRLRDNCHRRAIPFGLSLADYARFAEALPLGREKGQFVLAPRKPELGYMPGNIVVRGVTAHARTTRARDTEVPRVAVSPGVLHLYPGTAKPFAVRVGSKWIGNFATADEAVEARSRYVAENPPATALGTGRGWTLVKRCKTRPYRVCVGGRHSFHATPEEARAAYLKACAEIVAARAASATAHTPILPPPHQLLGQAHVLRGRGCDAATNRVAHAQPSPGFNG
jgi:hypothetical protein